MACLNVMLRQAVQGRRVRILHRTRDGAIDLTAMRTRIRRRGEKS
jgi:hypothetical protein